MLISASFIETAAEAGIDDSDININITAAAKILFIKTPLYIVFWLHL